MHYKHAVSEYKKFEIQKSRCYLGWNTSLVNITNNCGMKSDTHFSLPFVKYTSILESVNINQVVGPILGAAFFYI